MYRKLQIIVLSGAFLVFAFFISCHGSKKTTSSTAIPAIKVSDVKIKTIASIIGVSEKELAGKKLYEFVSDWYGVPYKY